MPIQLSRTIFKCVHLHHHFLTVSPRSTWRGRWTRGPCPCRRRPRRGEPCRGRRSPQPAFQKIYLLVFWLQYKNNKYKYNKNNCLLIDASKVHSRTHIQDLCQVSFYDRISANCYRQVCLTKQLSWQHRGSWQTWTPGTPMSERRSVKRPGSDSNSSQPSVRSCTDAILVLRLSYKFCIYFLWHRASGTPNTGQLQWHCRYLNMVMYTTYQLFYTIIHFFQVLAVLIIAMFTWKVTQTPRRPACQRYFGYGTL